MNPERDPAPIAPEPPPRASAKSWTISLHRSEVADDSRHRARWALRFRVAARWAPMKEAG